MKVTYQNKKFEHNGKTFRPCAGYVMLEDGTRFNGEIFGSQEPSLGEAVFNTSHSGYQEILTDPSYSKQIVIFTAPHIGNVGVNKEDCESESIQAAGAVVRSFSPVASNWRSELSLQDWMISHNIPLLSGVDTRALTLHIRTAGAMRAGIFPKIIDKKEALERVLASPSMIGANLVSDVSCTTPYSFSSGDVRNTFRHQNERGSGLRVAVLDFGVKRSILEELARRGCDVRIFPAIASVEDIENNKFDGIVLSNGPGDPSAVLESIPTVGALLQRLLSPSWSRPILGICLGHQLLSLAAGFETYKLPFGHRGANHPVLRHSDGCVEISSQNHGFAVKKKDPPEGFAITHTNLNDNTVEGIAHNERPIFSVQYHPEASPGPLDGLSYFDHFVKMMKGNFNA